MQELQEKWVQSLGQEDSLEQEMATHSSILAWRIPWTEDLMCYSPWGHKEQGMTEQLSRQTHTTATKQTKKIRMISH